MNLAAARLPTGIAAWLTLGVVFWATAWLFDRRAGFFAALALLASFLFARFFRLAETDPLSALFTTAATFFLWRGMEQPGVRGPGSGIRNPNPESRSPSHAPLWFHAGAAMLGLALLAKGPQVLFVVLFIIAYAALRRKWDRLWAMVRCGAPLTFLVVGLPWWAYVYFTRGAARWRSEVEIAAEGKDHPAAFYVYIPYILYGVAPWCAFVVGGVVESARRIGRDWRHLGLLLWAATILVPLCLIGNKQIHYLIPLMMPLMIITGWLIGQLWVRTEDAGFMRAMRWMLLGTIIGCLLVPLAVVLAARANAHRISLFDWATAAGVALLGLIALMAWLRLSLARAMGVFSCCAVLCMVWLVGQWMPSVEDASYIPLSRAMQRYTPDQSVIFYGRYANLRLSYLLGRVVPVISDPDDLRAWLKQRPDSVVIVLSMGKSNGLPPPEFLVQKEILKTRGETFGIYGGGE